MESNPIYEILERHKISLTKSKPEEKMDKITFEEFLNNYFSS